MELNISTGSWLNRLKSFYDTLIFGMIFNLFQVYASLESKDLYVSRYRLLDGVFPLHHWCGCE